MDVADRPGQEKEEGDDTSNTMQEGSFNTRQLIT